MGKTRITTHQAQNMPERCGVKFYYKPHLRKFIYGLHRHKFIEIEYMVSGHFKNDLCGTEFELSGGDFYCLGLGDYHSLEIDEGSTLYSLSINYKNMPPIIQHMLNSTDFPRAGQIPDDERGKVEELFAMIGRLVESKEPYAEEKLTAYLILLFSIILERSSRVDSKKTPSGYRHVLKAIDYLEEHYTEHVTLEEVACAVFLSPNHFSKLFSDMNGMTFSEYLARMRVDKARRALTATDKAVAEVATECGFSSFSSFSRNFKRICGCSPSEFRVNDNSVNSKFD